jgi:hypothetical protein
MPRVAILIPNPIEPLHFRTECLKRALSEAYEVKIFQARPGPSWLRWLNALSLTAFRLSNLMMHRNELADADLVIVQEMSLLAHAVAAHWSGQRVIYEVIDNGPHYAAYYIGQNFPFMRKLKLLPQLLAAVEKILVKAAAAPVVVNSKALLDHFGGRATLIYYCSPLEMHGLVNDPKLPPAFLYLGGIVEEKGVLDIPALTTRWGIPAFIFGRATEKNRWILDLFKASPGVVVGGVLGSHDLARELAKLMQRHFLIGVSRQRPTNLSYATQEVNKDIDYLAIGAPIVGNRRGPTWEKIKSGCGVLADDEEAMAQLLSDSRKRARMSKTCRDYYQRHYSYQMFRQRLLAIVDQQFQSLTARNKSQI